MFDYKYGKTLKFGNLQRNFLIMRFLVLAIVAVITTSCFNSPTPKCTDFKTGTFSFTYTINGEEKTGVIERNEKYQIEHYENKVDTSAIRWVNDCEFTATLLHPKTNAEKKPILIKILTTTQNSYTFEYNEVGDLKNKHKGEVFKVKK